MTRLIDISDVDPASVVCVLEPYRDQVDNTYLSADAINRQLKAVKYEAYEDRWAIVQFSDAGVLQISTIKQKQKRLNEASPSGVQRSRGFCGQAKSITLDLSIDNQIRFQLEGEK